MTLDEIVKRYGVPKTIIRKYFPRGEVRRFRSRKGFFWTQEVWSQAAVESSLLLPEVKEAVQKRREELLELQQCREITALFAQYSPEAYVERARRLDRQFILHVGPTNSGKTYDAIEDLKKWTPGTYLGPLRLLALEMYDKINAAGIPCTMLTGEEYLPQMIFDAYSNANELDPAQVEGLIHCYKEGIGTGRDIYKAKGYEAQYALNGGIEERFNVGIDAYYNAETMRATEWFQNALLAENADDHAGLKCFMRVLLGRMHSTDENGQAIDEGQELRELFDMAQTQYDAEAAWCVAQLMDNSDVQLRYYELGAGGSPDKYAKACAQQAEQIRIEIEQAELRARKEEEQRRLEEAQRKQEEEKRAALEKEMQELEARRREEERYEQSQNAFGFNDKYVGGSEKSSDLEGALARFDFPTTWIVIALIIFWPLGVFMGMTTTRWTLKGKTILAIIIGLFIILGLMVSALPS